MNAKDTKRPDLNGERVRVIEVGIPLREVGVLALEVSPGPACVQLCVGIGGRHPNVHRTEVGVVLVRIAHVLDDGHEAVVVKVAHAGHGRVHPVDGSAVHGQNLVLRQHDMRPLCSQLVELVQRDKSVEAVVAPIQLDEHQHAAMRVATLCQCAEEGHVGHGVHSEAPVHK